MTLTPKLTPKQVREKWVAALRSGEYQQGTKFLEKDGKFCCLGVLCDLAVKEDVAKRERFVTGVVTGVVYYGKSLTEDRVLPDNVRRWAGLYGRSGDYGNAVDNLSLTRLNDTGSSFEEIADLIENPPAGLFHGSDATSTESTISEGA